MVNNFVLFQLIALFAVLAVASAAPSWGHHGAIVAAVPVSHTAIVAAPVGHAGIVVAGPAHHGAVISHGWGGWGHGWGHGW